MEPTAEAQDDFFERSFEEVEDGYFDKRGFYNTPNGSFWDEEGSYFNHMGLDKHGGSYDKYGVYLPGRGWNEDLNCYENEIDRNNLQDNVCSQVIDNLKDELIDEFNRGMSDELDEAQMKKIYDEAVKMNSKKKMPPQSEQKDMLKSPQPKVEVLKENSDQIMTD